MRSSRTGAFASSSSASREARTSSFETPIPAGQWRRGGLPWRASRSRKASAESFTSQGLDDSREERGSFVAARDTFVIQSVQVSLMNRDVEVEITYLPPEHGGRTLPVWSGYRPQFYYLGHDWDAHHEYPDAEQVQPGQTARAYLTCLSPAEHAGKITVGMPFLIREGNRVVGYGSVRRILDLEDAATSARRVRSQ